MKLLVHMQMSLPRKRKKRVKGEQVGVLITWVLTAEADAEVGYVNGFICRNWSQLLGFVVVLFFFFWFCLSCDGPLELRKHVIGRKVYL